MTLQTHTITVVDLNKLKKLSMADISFFVLDYIILLMLK